MSVTVTLSRMPTREDVARALKAVFMARGFEAAVSLLRQFRAKRLSEVSPNDYDALIKEATGWLPEVWEAEPPAQKPAPREERTGIAPSSGYRLDIVELDAQSKKVI